MKAVIMAGGEGTRLRPLTYNQPKPMIPMANKALMEHVIALLRRHGFSDIVVTVAFHANTIRNYFGNGSEFGVRMVYATEEHPLGTAGSVRNAMRELQEPFLVISGDVLTDIDLGAVISYHDEHKALATIALRPMPNPLEFGIVMTNPDGTVDRFLEKPTWGQVFSDTINTGIYVLQPEIFDYIPTGVADFSSDVFPRLLEQGPLLYGYVTDGYWEDIGTLEAYARAHQDILDGRAQVQVPGFAMSQGIWLGEGAEIDPAAEIKGPAIIGDYSKVEAGARIGEYSVLGRNVRVGPDSHVERAVVHDNAYLAAGVRLHGCVVGRGSDLRRGARLEDGVVIGDECFIGEHAVVHPGVKVFPFKTVEHGAIVNSSIVWESRGPRSLFGRSGVAGLANVDISPELAVRLAMAYATTMPKGVRVAVSRDASGVARVLEQAVVIGLNAAGANVVDLDVATVPVTRFAVGNEACAGGVTVRLSPEDPQSVVLRFFDRDGIDIPEVSQRKIERIYYREDFRRCMGPDTGDVFYPSRAQERYANVLLSTVDTDAIRKARFKVVLDYAFGATSFVMPFVLGRLGAEVLSVNPYAATYESAVYDRWDHARSVAALVRSAGAHLGAVLSPDGERLSLVDDKGRALSDTEGLLSLLSLVLGHYGNDRDPHAPTTACAVLRGGPESAGREGPEAYAAGPSASSSEGQPAISLPVSAPEAARRMCERWGLPVLWAKLSVSHLMEVSSGPGMCFGASGDGGYIFSRFLPAFDAVAALVQAMSLLAIGGHRLSDVVGRLPEVFTAHEGVVTPWEKKGMVMRSVMEMGRDRRMVLVDGVKILHDDGWCLVVPDPEEALTHVWAEGPSDAGARARAQDYARQVRNLLRA